MGACCDSTTPSENNDNYNVESSTQNKKNEHKPQHNTQSIQMGNNKWMDMTDENKNDSPITTDNIDFKMFEETKKECNAQSDQETEMIKNCSSLLRIAYGLKYYEILSKDIDKNNTFIEFIQT